MRQAMRDHRKCALNPLELGKHIGAAVEMDAVAAVQLHRESLARSACWLSDRCPKCVFRFRTLWVRALVRRVRRVIPACRGRNYVAVAKAGSRMSAASSGQR
jgi:hypothetical protein